MSGARFTAFRFDDCPAEPGQGDIVRFSALAIRNVRSCKEPDRSGRVAGYSVGVPLQREERFREIHWISVGWQTNLKRFVCINWRWSQSPANRSLVRLSRFDGNLTGNPLFLATDAQHARPQSPNLRRYANGIPVDR